MNGLSTCVRLSSACRLSNSIGRTGILSSCYLATSNSGPKNTSPLWVPVPRPVQQHRQYQGRGSTSSRAGWTLGVAAGAAVALGGALYYSSKDEDFSLGAVHAAAGPGAKEDMMLYWASGSPFCWRLMIVLEEKGLSGYNNRLVSMSKGELKIPEVGALNPRYQVPTFRHGKTVVNESLAACDYVENTFKKKGNQLIPDDREKQALVLQRKYEALNIYYKGIFDVFFYSRGDKVDKGELSKRKLSLASELLYWENHLHQQGPGSFIAGSSFSMADAVFFPALAMLVRLGLRLDQRPNLKAYYDMVSGRPSVKASWPPHWRETPPSIFELADV